MLKRLPLGVSGEERRNTKPPSPRPSVPVPGSVSHRSENGHLVRTLRLNVTFSLCVVQNSYVGIVWGWGGGFFVVTGNEVFSFLFRPSPAGVHLQS